MNDYTKTQRDYAMPDFTKNIVVESTPRVGKNYFRERYLKLLGMNGGEDKADAFAYAMYGPGGKAMAAKVKIPDKLYMSSQAFTATEKDLAADGGVPGMIGMPTIQLRKYVTPKPPKFIADDPAGRARYLKIMDDAMAVDTTGKELTLKFKDGRWQ